MTSVTTLQWSDWITKSHNHVIIRLSHTHTLKLHQHFQTNTLWLLLLLYTYTKLGRDFQLGCVETYKEVDKDHEDDGRDDSKVTDEHTSLQHRCHHRSITLYWDTDENHLTNKILKIQHMTKYLEKLLRTFQTILSVKWVQFLTHKIQ